VTLVERGEALRVSEDMVAAATRRNGGVVLITGPVGSGKTEMICALRRIAVAAGCAVFEAAASAAEHDVPGGIVRQLFRNADGLTPDGRTLFDLCAEVLDRADRSGPLLIVVDDVQHADQFSINFLLSLISRLSRQRILVVLGELDGAESMTLLHAEILRQPQSRRIRLGPLSLAGVQQTLIDRLDTRAAMKLATECHAASGGNPLLVHALIDDYLAARAAHSSRRRPRLTVGYSFRETVVASMYRCGTHAVEVARGIATLGGIGSTARLATLTGVPPHVVDRVVKALTDGGFLNLEGFRHSSAADAVLAELDTADLARLGFRAAELLYEEGLPALDVARQLVAMPGVPGEWATEVLVQAADSAQIEGRTHLAEKCLNLADQTCRDERRRAPILAMLASLSWQANPMTTGRYLSRLTESGVDDLAVPTVAMLIKYLLWCGRLDQAQQVAKRLDAPLDDRPVARFWLGYTYPAVLDRVSTGALSALAASDLRTTRPLLPAAVALHTVLVEGPERTAVASAEWSLHGKALTHETLVPVLTALEALTHADELVKALRWCDTFIAAARRCDAPMWEALFVAMEAKIAFLAGELPVAERHARAALTTVAQESWGLAIGDPLATLVRTLTAQGYYEEAARYLAKPVPEGIADTRFGLAHRYARAHLHLASGHLETALAGFRACGDLVAHWGLDLPVLLPWRTDLAEVHLQLGQREQARALAEEQVSLLGLRRCRSTGQALRVLAVAGGTDDLAAMLTEAAELAQRSGDRLGLANALCDLSDALLDRGEFDQVRPTLQRAWRLAEACRSEPMHGKLSASRAGRWAGLPTASRDHMKTLSTAERKVAALAANGYANREIADQLFVTVSTVEQHLTKAYRKLRVNRRKDLPSDLTYDVVDVPDTLYGKQLQEF
jgi:DNA-binding CsgD family transcriptional regulator